MVQSEPSPASWASLVDSASEHDYEINPSSNKYGMLVFYNLNIDAVACKNRQGQHSVHDVLELDP